MDNPEKLATKGTQDEEKQKQKPKHNTICVGHHYAQANTNNVNKTFFLSSVGGLLHKQKCRGNCLYAYKCMFF